MYNTKTPSVVVSSSDTLGMAAIAFVIALAAAIVIYFVFMPKSQEKKYTGFVKKLYDYLHFNNFFLEVFLKISYIFVALYITIMALGQISTSFFAFLVTLIVGNLVARICFELTIVLYKICVNTSEINKKLK